MHKTSLKKILIVTVSAVVVIVFVVLLYKWKIGADVPEQLNPNISLYQIPEFSNGSQKTPLDGTYEISVPKGEKKSVEILFDNHSATSYNNLTVGKNEFISSNGQTIPTANIDERVIHVWPKKYRPLSHPSPADAQCTQTVQSEDLLVRNEKPDLTVPTDSKYHGDTFFSEQIGTLPADLLRSTGYAQSETGDAIKTNVQANTTKKFYFTVTAPNDKTGAFSSTVNFIDLANNQIVAKFNIKLKIYDFNLTSLSQNNPPYINGTYMNEQIKNSVAYPASLNASMIDATLFRQRLDVVKNQGINALVIRVGKYSDTHEMVKEINDMGFVQRLILNFYGDNYNKSTEISGEPDISDFANMVKSISADSSITVPIMFYGPDEPNSVDSRASFKRKADNIVAILHDTSKVPSLPSNIIPEVTSSELVNTYNYFASDTSANSANYKTSYPIYNFFSDGLMSQATSHPLAGDTYYYQGWGIIQKPDGSFAPLDRYYSGIGIAKSGLSGAFVNPLWGYSGIQNKPYYDDFANECDANGNNCDACKKPMLTFYPASDGLIPNMESESWREGTMDLRFYLEYQKLKGLDQSALSPAKRNSLAQAAAGVERNLAKYSFTNTSAPVPDDPGYAGHADGNGHDMAQELPSGLTSEIMSETRNFLENYVFSYYGPDAPAVESVNLADNQTITTNPYALTVNYSNTTASTINLYANDQLITSQVEAVGATSHTFSLDPEPYNLGNVTIKVEVINGMGDSISVSKAVRVNLASNPPADTTQPQLSDLDISEGLAVTTDPFVIKTKATDDTAVAKVEFYQDSTLLGSVTTADAQGYYSYSLATAALNHTNPRLRVIAYDAANNTAQAEFNVSISIAGETVPPTLSEESIQDGQTITSSPYKVKVKARDESGIDKVEFYANGSLLSAEKVTDGEGFYTYNFNSIGFNELTIPFKIVAYDVHNNAATKNYQLSINVPDSENPSLDLMNIAEGQTITVNPYIVQAHASDNARVEKVVLYVDDFEVDQATRPDVDGVYELSWNTYTYHSTVKVVAYDSSGNTTEMIKKTTVNLAGGTGGSSAVGTAPANNDNSSGLAVLPKTGTDSIFRVCWKKILKVFVFVHLLL